MAALCKRATNAQKIVDGFITEIMAGDRSKVSHTSRCCKFRISSHRLGVILIVLSFVWGMYLIQVQINDRQSQSEYLKSKIIELSKEYIDAVAKEKGLVEMGDVDNGTCKAV